jgi:hypothetical protein
MKRLAGLSTLALIIGHQRLQLAYRRRWLFP